MTARTSRDHIKQDVYGDISGSWEKACASIRRVLSTLGPEHLAAVLILTAKNACDVAGTLAHYRSMGIRTVMVNRFNLGGNGLKNRNELIISGISLRMRRWLDVTRKCRQNVPDANCTRDAGADAVQPRSRCMALSEGWTPYWVF